MRILILNAGSTSLKFKLWLMPGETALSEGRIERVGSDRATLRFTCPGQSDVNLDNQRIPDYQTGIRLYLNYLTDTCVSSLSDIDAVGFKTVLSRGHSGVCFLTDDVLDGMRSTMSVAPAHNGPYLAAIEVCQHEMPGTPLIGAFETAFHDTIPLERRVYPVPYEWYTDHGVMRMGYHGASHGYIAHELSAYRRVISCHLGGSGSLCAILDGKSVDNSFGLSLQVGTPHAQRCGDIDPYIIPYMINQGMSMEQVFHELTTNGGMKGLSGTSGDMRDVIEAANAGSDRAKLAMDVYVTQVVRYIGAYYMELGGLDALAFTAGIGERSAVVRAMIMSRLQCIGVKYDPAANEACTGRAVISTPDSSAAVHVIPANEEYMVVKGAHDLICAAQGR